jgi:uncharacterized protein YndB with AHSA1/START domain
MLFTIIIAVVIVLGIFITYVSNRPNQFTYERSGFINAPAEKIYPYLCNFKLGEQWSPYEKMDLTMKKTFNGADGQVGSTMDFIGNSKAGSGRLEILSLIPNQRVDLKLTMTSPIKANNFVTYTLTPESTGTRFSWSMIGNNGFMGKFVTMIIDCEKMVAGHFSTGIENLKNVVEKAK